MRNYHVCRQLVKSNHHRLTAAVVFLSILSLQGCNSSMSPGVRYVALSQAYTAALNTSRPLIDARLIPKDELRGMKLASDRIDAALDKMGEALAAGNKVDFDYWFQIAQDNYDLFDRSVWKAKRKGEPDDGS